MATLQDISIRLKSVKNIQKITQSMKMVSAAKFSRAERDLKAARPFGFGAKKFYENVKPEEQSDVILTETVPEKKKLIIAISSDRGLCGGIHSGIAKVIKKDVEDDPTVMVVCVGDKIRSILSRYCGDRILFACNEVGRLPPTFDDASKVAEALMKVDYQFSEGAIYYNYFNSVVSYKAENIPIFHLDTLTNAAGFQSYDSVDEELSFLNLGVPFMFDNLDQDLMMSYNEFLLASLIFYAMKESACSEQSSRMTAMENASKNAGEMIDKLTLTFNRTRQAVITRELIEIISGAAAL